MKHVILASSLMASMVLASPAMAAGVSAGTVISNTASAEYTDSSGQAKSLNSNTVDITVAELINVAVASAGAAATTGTPGEYVLPFEVSNIGNGPESFTLQLNPAVAGNEFETTLVRIVLDDGDGIYEPGVDQVLTEPLSTGELAAGATVKLFVIVQAPPGALDQQTSAVQLTATSSTGTGSAGTVIAGAGPGGIDAVIGTTTGTARATGALQASVATVALEKTAAVADPFGGSQIVPGAAITYTIKATVSGGGAITGLKITDVIPVGTTYVPDSLKLNAGALTDAADGDAGTASASGIAVNVGTAQAASSPTVTFQVRVN